jgi:hypothetical protein
MARCLHIYQSGFQCIDESIEASEFCESHQKVVEFEFEKLKDSPWRRLFLRVIALVLLLLFLIPFLDTLRGLYVGPPVKAQEGW